MPGWLQRYFNKNEDVCSCSTDAREVPQWPENREDDHLMYADEESSNIHDGRITPEPTVSNTEGTQNVNILLRVISFHALILNIFILLGCGKSNCGRRVMIRIK